LPSISVYELSHQNGAVTVEGQDVYIDPAEMAVGSFLRVTVTFVSSDEYSADCRDELFDRLIAGSIDAQRKLVRGCWTK
jgi:hypothetical protein